VNLQGGHRLRNAVTHHLRGQTFPEKPSDDKTNRNGKEDPGSALFESERDQYPLQPPHRENQNSGTQPNPHPNKSR
jgi:hypothetical protein